MIIQLEEIWDLRIRLPQVWLIPTTCIVVEIRMCDLFIMFCGPWRIFSILLPSDLNPFLPTDVSIPNPYIKVLTLLQTLKHVSSFHIRSA
jgi:hypothetical protein